MTNKKFEVMFTRPAKAYTIAVPVQWFNWKLGCSR